MAESDESDANLPGLSILFSSSREDPEVGPISSPADDFVYLPKFELVPCLQFVSLFMIGACYGDFSEIHSVFFPLEMRPRTRTHKSILDVLTSQVNCNLLPAVISFLCFGDPDYSRDTSEPLASAPLISMLDSCFLSRGLP
jgi:hypothetical protein